MSWKKAKKNILAFSDLVMLIINTSYCSFLFLVVRYLLYNIVVVSAIQQCESAVSTHVNIFSLLSLPPSSLISPL